MARLPTRYHVPIEADRMRPRLRGGLYGSQDGMTERLDRGTQSRPRAATRGTGRTTIMPTCEGGHEHAGILR